MMSWWCHDEDGMLSLGGELVNCIQLNFSKSVIQIIELSTMKWNLFIFNKLYKKQL